MRGVTLILTLLLSACVGMPKETLPQRMQLQVYQLQWNQIQSDMHQSMGLQPNGLLR